MIRKGLCLATLSAITHKKVATMQTLNGQILNEQLKMIKFTSREGHLNNIEQNPEYDLLIIGGGASGCGSLINASLKGLRTIMVEAYDFGASTSTKSTKLLHGGLRYLERAFMPFNKNRKADFDLVDEALQERNLLINNAPYMTDQVGMVIPCSNIFTTLFYFAGCQVYYYYSRFSKNPFIKNLPIKIHKPIMVFKKDLQEFFPGIHEKFKYGVLMWDGQFDESRMIMESILTSTALDHSKIKKADVLNYTKVSSFIKNENGKIVGAKLYDKINEKEIEIKCKVALNATGVFSDQIRKDANPDLKPLLQFSKGDHITLDNTILTNSKIGLLIPKTSDGRLMFVLPWADAVIAGTTDTAVNEPVVHPYPENESVDIIVKNIVDYLPYSNINVKSKWSGLRPLIKIEGKSSKDVPRSHIIERDDKSGLISLMGGKWTTFRSMGAAAIDEVLKKLRDDHLITKDDYQNRLKIDSRNMRFIGDYRQKFYFPDEKSKELSKEEYMREIYQALSEKYTFINLNAIKRLFGLYGIKSIFILEDMKKSPSNQTLLTPNYPITKAEVKYLLKYEYVEQPLDIITKRLRTAFTDAAIVDQILPMIIDIYGDHKGWDINKKTEEYDFNKRLFEDLMYS